jgi:hypothetical protein
MKLVAALLIVAASIACHSPITNDETPCAPSYQRVSQNGVGVCVPR